MPSDLVMRRFRLLERIGSGGMGVVYRAFDERLQREVAVKEITAPDPERVLREAQAGARLNHPGIVTLYEMGRDGDRALLVSELVPGPTLAELRAAGELSDRDVAELGADLCDALAHAHARGVIHRDLKPQNVIARDDESAGRRAKLMDFGIARLAGAPTLTASGEVVGTLAYMAPEQAEGNGVGPAADVYALGLTLYECWGGLNPVAAESPAATARQIGAPIPSLARHRPDLPEELTASIDACLAPEQERRPTSTELRASLDAAIPALDPGRLIPSPVNAEPSRAPRRRHRLASPLILLAASGLLALLAGPGGAPGLALVLAALGLPALLTLPRASCLLPLSGVPLGAAGALLAYPAVAALVATRAGPRALAGALGWLWALAAASALGIGSGSGIVARAPHGWESSVPDAVSGVLIPLLAGPALLGAGLFALGAMTLGWILSARHLAVAAVGALPWAAGLTAALGMLGDGALGERPLLAALGAATALVVERARRSRQGRSRRNVRPLPPLEWSRTPAASAAAQGGH